MFTVGRKVSFSVVAALLIGWGVGSLLLMQSSVILAEAQTYELDRPVPLPTGVQLNLQVDKKVYRGGDTVLIALRNDSRLPIWLAEHADGCSGSWWQIDFLESDGVTWSPLQLSTSHCLQKLFGLSKFTRHTLRTAEWLSVEYAGKQNALVVPVPLGTYRIRTPYLKGGAAKESDWTALKVRTAVSPSFTIQ